MTVEELGHKCKSETCEKCPYQKECQRFDELLSGIAPVGILTILQAELN